MKELSITFLSFPCIMCGVGEGGERVPWPTRGGQKRRGQFSAYIGSVLGTECRLSGLTASAITL